MLQVHFVQYISLQLTVHHQVYLTSHFLGHPICLLFDGSQTLAEQNGRKHKQHR